MAVSLFKKGKPGRITMRIVIAAQDLNNGMNRVSRVLVPKSAHPIYDSVLIETKQDSVEISCTNGENSIKCVLPALCREEGRIALPAKLLYELARKLEGDIEISIKDKQNALIKSYESATTMVLMEESVFPKADEVEEGQKVILPKKVFKEAVSRVIFAVSSDVTRNILTGCLMEVLPDEIRFVCLDGYRLAMQRIECVNPLPQGKDKLSYILPGALTGEISRMIPDTEGNITLSMGSLHFKAEFDNTRVYGSRVVGEYINYRQILPTSWTTSLRLESAEFKKAIERASLIAREGKNNLLSLKIDDKTIVITAVAEMGEAVEKVSVDLDGNPLSIAFNANYLSDVINKVETEDMAMRFNTSVSPCVVCPVSGNRYLYLILPIRV